MIHMDEDTPAKNFETDKELYEALREHIGKLVLIRRAVIERAGVLQHLSYNREAETRYPRVSGSFGQEEAFTLNRLHRVEVRLDGAWKVLNPGHEDNLEL